MSRIRQRSHASVTSLATEQRRQVREIARREFDRDGHTVPRHLLSRGEVDPFSGEVNLGLDRMKLASQTLTEAEQATNSTDGRVLASGNTNAERAVDGNHIKTSSIVDDHINGTLAKTTIGTGGKWSKDDQHADTIYKNADGHVPKGDLPKDAVYGNAQGKLSYADLQGDFPGLKSLPKNAITKNELENILKKYQKKGGGN